MGLKKLLGFLSRIPISVRLALPLFVIAVGLLLASLNVTGILADFVADNPDTSAALARNGLSESSPLPMILRIAGGVLALSAAAGLLRKLIGLMTLRAA